MTFDRAASWGTYRARVTRVKLDGHRWTGKTPRNRFVRAKRPSR